jgi:putative FmdB family regulatory protein
MPIYEYECEGCGQASSALLPRFDSPDPVCPHCGEPRLHRLVSTFATTGRDDGGGDDFGGGLGGHEDFGGHEDLGGHDDFGGHGGDFSGGGGAGGADDLGDDDW